MRRGPRAPARLLRARPRATGLPGALPALLRLLALSLLLARSARAEETEQILDLFARRCVECHGPSKSSAKLRLDSLDAVFRGGRSGPVVTAARRAESILYARVSSTDPDERMPPKGEALSASEVESIGRWIDAGARAGVSKGSVPVTVKPRADRIPAGRAPVFSIAAVLQGRRIAVGRGNAVEVYSIEESAGSDDKKDEKKKGRNAELTQRLEATLDQHAGLVTALAFTSDGKRLASGEYRVVRVWDTATWGLIATLEDHADQVLVVAFDPSGEKVAAGGGLPTESGEVKAWDLATKGPLWSVTPHTDTVLGLAWSRDGGRLFTGGADRVSYVLDARSGKTERRLEAHTNHIEAVAFDAEGKRGASAGADRAVRLWDLENGEYLESLKGHDGPVTSVAFSVDGKELLSTGADGSIRAHDASNGNQRYSLSPGKGYLQSGALLEKGAWYVAAEQDGPVHLFDLAQRKLILTISPPGPPSKS